MEGIEIIGISGKAGTGKDFIGREVLRPLGYKQYAFAWPFKMEAVGQGFSYDAVFGAKPPRVREALQLLGSEQGWHIHGRKYWCEVAGAWMRTMNEAYGFDKFYVSDVRFPHEVDWILRNGGKVVRMVHGEGREYPLNDAARVHESETALDGFEAFDAVIVNDADTTPGQMRTVLAQCGVLSSFRHAVPGTKCIDGAAFNDPRQLELPLVKPETRRAVDDLIRRQRSGY